jgi:hypothetical protein
MYTYGMSATARYNSLQVGNAIVLRSLYYDLWSYEMTN